MERLRDILLHKVFLFIEMNEKLAVNLMNNWLDDIAIELIGINVLVEILTSSALDPSTIQSYDLSV